jgi:putative transposase
MERNMGLLLKYYAYPESIRRSIHSTNLIERMNEEIRRRIKIIDSLQSEESAIGLSPLILDRYYSGQSILDDFSKKNKDIHHTQDEFPDKVTQGTEGNHPKIYE